MTEMCSIKKKEIFFYKIHTPHTPLADVWIVPGAIRLRCDYQKDVFQSERNLDLELQIEVVCKFENFVLCNFDIRISVGIFISIQT